MPRKSVVTRADRIKQKGKKPDISGQSITKTISDLEKRAREVHAELSELKKSIEKQSADNLKKIAKMEDILHSLILTLERSGKTVSFKKSTDSIAQITPVGIGDVERQR